MAMERNPFPVKIYTRTGDNGETGLWGGLRVAKDSLRVEAYGTVDECNAALGVARAAGVDEELDEILGRIQNQLFIVGADLATPGEATNIPRVSSGEITALETTIDTLEGEVKPLRQFILPGGDLAAAHIHLARTICRRAERIVVSLSTQEAINSQVQIYLNRLSDLLFVAARWVNQRTEVDDIPWEKP